MHNPILQANSMQDYELFKSLHPGARIIVTDKLHKEIMQKYPSSVGDAPDYGDKRSLPGAAIDTTNPKDTIGSTKVPLSLVPAVYTAEISLAFLEGKLKYGEVNWRATPVRASVYIDAAFRHLKKFSEGEDRDPVSQVHHLANASACFGIIIDAYHYGTLIDDRKMSNGPGIVWIDSLSRNVKHLQELFADKNPKHYKISDLPPGSE